MKNIATTEDVLAQNSLKPSVRESASGHTSAKMQQELSQRLKANKAA